MIFKKTKINETVEIDPLRYRYCTGTGLTPGGGPIDATHYIGYGQWAKLVNNQWYSFSDCRGVPQERQWESICHDTHKPSINDFDQYEFDKSVAFSPSGSIINRKPLLLTDCDGVLLRWSANIPAFLTSLGICIKHLDGYLHGNQMIPFDILFPAESKEDSMALMMQYNESEFIARLPIMEPNSDHNLRRLQQHFDIVVITNISEQPNAATLRKENLIAVHGDIFEDIICLNPHSDKTEAIRKFVETREVVLWVDDNMDHVKEGQRVGVSSVQFTYDMQCGRNTGEAPELNSWSHIESYLMHSHFPKVKKLA